MCLVRVRSCVRFARSLDHFSDSSMLTDREYLRISNYSVRLIRRGYARYEISVDGVTRTWVTLLTTP